tara:strand:+ start:842 stop:2374 length:1533 start_codon:yes stop_codon:yes gene_type:complete
MHILSRTVPSAAKANKKESSASATRAESQSASLSDNRPGTLAQMKVAEAMSQGSLAQKTTQLQAVIAGNAPVQKAEEEEEVQMKAAPVQKAEDEEEVQMKAAPVQRKENNTGLPDNLKSGVENLSGVSLDDVSVHHNSDQPAQMQAHAFAQGTDIHVAPGQEQHLAHEAWHVVQQKQGRVQPTKQMKGDIPVNDDKGLENEADMMGAKALKLGTENQSATQLKEVNSSNIAIQKSATNTVQKEGDEEETLPDVEGSQSLMGGTLTISDSDADGESSISFEHPLFTATGTKTAVGDPKKGVREYTLTGEPPAFSTPELAFSLPLPPVPLGIPGLFLTASIEGAASASLSGSATIGFTSTNGVFSDPNIKGALAAKAEGNLGIEGGVTAGVPGLAGITVGAYGKLNAELSGQIELVGSSKGLEMNGEIAGEATGEAGVFASANILWVTVTKQVPVVEGTLGEFKGTKEGVPFNMSGLKELANLSSYDFSKDEGDGSKAAAKAEDDHKKGATA